MSLQRPTMPETRAGDRTRFDPCRGRWLALLLLAMASGCAMVDRFTGEDVNRAVRSTGLPAMATVLAIADSGVTVNDDPVVLFRLRVEAEGRPPWEAETRALVSLLAIPQIQPGAVLPVKFDPLDPSRVAIDTESDTEGGAEARAAELPAGAEILGQDLSLERVADGVWLVTSYQELEGFGNTPANGLVVVSGREAALVNTPWTAEQTARLIEWLAGRGSVAVSTVVVTHSHGDCLGGLAAAHQAGARSFALVRTVELARAAGREAPQVGFTDRLDLQVGARRLELRYLGPGHTEDNIVAWLPDVGVLFGGCLVRSAAATTLGYTDEADLERWPATIEAVEREYGARVRLVVPGHGSPGGVELLAHTLELLRR